jgi:hypothetical protein
MASQEKNSMKLPANLTGLSVARHRYPSPPLLDGACPGLRLIALTPTAKEHQRGSWIELTAADFVYSWKRNVDPQLYLLRALYYRRLTKARSCTSASDAR